MFSVVLLGLCFLVLGVVSGAIPVKVPGPPAPEEPAVRADAEAVPASVVPTARTMPKVTAPPKAAPTPGPSAGPSDAPLPTDAPEPTAAPSAVPHPTDEPAPTDAPEPTDMPSPSAAPSPTPGPTPEPEPVTAPAAEELWEPDVAAISTTITWKNDPMNNQTAHAVDAFALLDQPPAISLPEKGPQILIIHTHGTEAYTPDGTDRYEAVEPYRTTDKDYNVIRVGQALGDALEEYGLDVLVDTGLYDYPNYVGAYDRCGEAVEGYLAEYPDLAMVIDLHRDAIGDGEITYAPVSDQAGGQAAQMMFVMGSDGVFSYPNWEDNLALAMSLQGLVEEKFPRLMRPTTLCSERYNQQMTTGSLLLEVGAAGNTLEEALAAVDLFAQAVGPALADRIGA